MRIKSRWSKKGKTHTIEEIAGAVAFINWRIAGNCLLSLENNDFQTDTHEQRLKIISEFLIFTIHMIDRMTIENFDGNERVRFITELVTKTAKHLEDNKRDLIGPGDYRDAFIQLLNDRISEYSEFSYDEKDGPSFPMKRFFGDKVAEVMGEKNQKWVADQVIEIEVRDIMSHLRKSVPNLFK
ncbi:MAG: hypothetical protein OEY78_08750 [Gammaproteobacteria bacterium]|nr:hypothetical protein [Gammaproteobacteria bacterium]